MIEYFIVSCDWGEDNHEFWFQQDPGGAKDLGEVVISNCQGSRICSHGYCLKNGLGADPEFAKTAEHYKLYAEQGNDNGRNHNGFCMLNEPSVHERLEIAAQYSECQPISVMQFVNRIADARSIAGLALQRILKRRTRLTD
jgi:hypothetical protein